jgi:hypothetical protein
MTVYISGAVTGVPDNNREVFSSAYKLINGYRGSPAFRGGLKIINPLHLAGRLDKQYAALGKRPQWADYMRACIKKLCESECVYFLEDWTRSEGASIERYIAKRLGIPCADTIDELKNILGV